MARAGSLAFGPAAQAPLRAAAVAGSAGAALLRAIGRLLLHKPGVSFAVVGGLCLSGAIFANALLLQPQRHPYPLFTGAIAPQGKARRDVPMPPSRIDASREEARFLALANDTRQELARRGFYVEATADSAGTTLESAIRDYQEAAGIRIDGLPSDALLINIRASKLTVKDQILHLLQPGQVQPGQASADAQKTLLMAQKALNRLGYGPLKEDGLFGPGTRAAIERFERDKRLPVKGEAEGRTLRELSLASGMAVE